MAQLPTGTGMIETGGRSGVGGHGVHVLLATMDSLSWPYQKVNKVASDEFGLGQLF